MAGDMHLDGVRRHSTVVAVITGVMVSEHAYIETKSVSVERALSIADIVQIYSVISGMGGRYVPLPLLLP